MGTMTYADPESFARGGPTLATFFLFVFDERRMDQNTTKCRSSSFKWRFADEPMMAQH